MKNEISKQQVPVSKNLTKTLIEPARLTSKNDQEAVESILLGFLNPALQEGMEKDSPEYVVQLRKAVVTAREAKNVQEHLDLAKGQQTSV